MITNELLQKLEDLLDNYFEEEKPLNLGISTVQFLADHLNISANYLSRYAMLTYRTDCPTAYSPETDRKIERILSTSNLTISEVAYKLGFEHPQSFSRLFKNKTMISQQLL